jgi:hypothetical protein
MVGSVREDRVPSSIRIWRAERAKKMNKTPCSTRCCIAALQLVFSHLLHYEGILLYSQASAALDYIPAAVPSGAVQEARCPAGTLGDIQAVTIIGIIMTGWNNDKEKLAIIKGIVKGMMRIIIPGKIILKKGVIKGIIKGIVKGIVKGTIRGTIRNNSFKVVIIPNYS